MNDTLEFDTGLVTIRQRWGQEEVSPRCVFMGFWIMLLVLIVLRQSFMDLILLPWTLPVMAGPTTDLSACLFRPK